jgi:hypothetical protein
MTVDTITIVLDGEIPFGDFARTINSFYELIKALSDEVGTPDLDWVLDDLQVSSAFATARASSDPKAAEKVAIAYGDVGGALESDTPMNHSDRVRAAANKVISINDPRVRSVRFETPIREVTVKPRRERAPDSIAPLADVPPYPSSIVQPAPLLVPELPPRPLAKLTVALPPALGGIQGRVQALSNRGGLRFTIYDLLYDKAVGCYVADGKEELLRNMWGKLAIVEGLVTRDPVTGRPLSIRQVRNITPVSELSPDMRFEYTQARGILPNYDLSPEDAIRRIRDAQ